MPKKILFVGVLDIAWSSNIPMKIEFEKRGYSVTPFNFRTIAKNFTLYRETNLPGLRGLHEQIGGFLYKLVDLFANCLKLPLFPPFIAKIGYTLNGRKKMNRMLLDFVKRGNYDLIFFAKADLIDYSLIPAINNYSNTWYFFMDSLDIALKVNACKYASKTTWSSATWSSVCHYFKKSGVNCFFITQGVDKSVYHPRSSVKKYDVIFVGSKNFKRKRLIDALLKQGIKVTVFGKGFPQGPIYSNALAKIYRESKIILNLKHRPGNGFSLRVFQAMGTGSMLLSEYSKDLKAIFLRGKHLDWFHDPDECAQLIRYYLDNEEDRERIARTGMEYVHSHYSWEKTIEKILCVLEKQSPKFDK